MTHVYVAEQEPFLRKSVEIKEWCHQSISSVKGSYLWSKVQSVFRIWLYVNIISFTYFKLTHSFPIPPFTEPWKRWTLSLFCGCFWGFFQGAEKGCNGNDWVKCQSYKFRFESDYNIVTRRSHRRCSVKKGVLKSFANLTGKHLCQSLVEVFPCEICEILNNTFFAKHLQTTTSM